MLLNNIINFILQDYLIFFNLNTLNYIKSNLYNTYIDNDLINLPTYHFTTPNIKLYYPEPFIASGTFLHYDIWFLHIAIYQYWLWFFFIYIIIFFVISFIITLRWCNIRIKPQRETRGVSRSKCGDLITATVPVSWACSIIIHESTDAIEYYDGFGTTEMAVGIRAYQWGWEYYYPKDIDLNYQLHSNNSLYFGKSLYYNQQNEVTSDSNKYLNYSKNKDIADLSIFSTSKLIFNSNNYSIWDFKNFGLSKTAIQWAHKSITDDRIFEKYEMDISFYRYNRKISKPVYEQVNTSNVKNYNSEWSFLSNSAKFNNSASFCNLNILNELINLKKNEKLVNSIKLPYKSNKNQLKISKYEQLAQSYIKKTLKSITTNILLTNYNPTIKDFDCKVKFKDGTNVLSNLNIRALTLSNLLHNKKWPEAYMYSGSDFKRIDDSLLMEEIYFEHNQPDSLFENYTQVTGPNKTQTYYFFKKNGNFGKINKNEHYKNLIKSNQQQYINNKNINSIEIKNDLLFSNYSLIPHFKLEWLNSLEKLNESNNNSFTTYKSVQSLIDFLNLNYLIESKNYSKSISTNSSLSSFWPDLESPQLSSNDFTEKHFFKNSLETYFKQFFPYVNNIIKNFKPLKSKEVFENLNFENASLVDSLKSVLTFDKSLIKIYRQSFFEGRSSVDFKNFTNQEQEQPVINYTIPKVKKAVNKNDTSFIKSNVYKKENYFDLYSSLLRGKNNFFFEFPFFTSLESDSIRYSWFDWYSKSNKVSTKAMDTASYNLYGNKSFSKQKPLNDFKSEKTSNYENYRIKVSNARKVNLPIWTYDLYLTKKYKSKQLNLTNESKANLLINSLEINLYSKAKEIKKQTFSQFNSNNNTTMRNYWKTPSNFSSLSDYTANLGDSITKKLYILSQVKKINYNDYNKFENIINLVKQDLLINTELSKNKNLYKSYLNQKFSKLNNRSLNSENNQTGHEYKKSQYKHMRKNISNMIRIHSEKAVAMPIETRIQILTVSKDIIHSWAIPSAGIKIDCIPGFSSHKVTIFLLSGVYWGQCMEICGRFHHWMPIVVYFMKRDLFILWCSHFVANNKNIKYLNSINSDFITNSNSKIYRNLDSWKFEI